MDRDLRKILVIAVLLAAIALGALSAVLYVSRDSVGYGQKCGGSYCWGYRLDQYRVPKRTVLTLWGTWGLNVTYKLPPMRIERAAEDRWLATDRAIYLNLWFRHDTDSAEQDQHVRIVYDFQRGVLNVSAPAQLWRVPDFRNSNPGKNWLTDEEFQRVLDTIEP